MAVKSEVEVRPRLGLDPRLLLNLRVIIQRIDAHNLANVLHGREHRQHSARLLHARAQHPLPLQARAPPLAPLLIDPPPRTSSRTRVGLEFRRLVKGELAHGGGAILRCVGRDWGWGMGVLVKGEGFEEYEGFFGCEQVSGTV